MKTRCVYWLIWAILIWKQLFPLHQAVTGPAEWIQAGAGFYSFTARRPGWFVLRRCGLGSLVLFPDKGVRLALTPTAHPLCHLVVCFLSVGSNWTTGRSPTLMPRHVFLSINWSFWVGASSRRASFSLLQGAEACWLIFFDFRAIKQAMRLQPHSLHLQTDMRAHKGGRGLVKLILYWTEV